MAEGRQGRADTDCFDSRTSSASLSDGSRDTLLALEEQPRTTASRLDEGYAFCLESRASGLDYIVSSTYHMAAALWRRQHQKIISHDILLCYTLDLS